VKPMQLCTFTVDRLVVGVDVQRVREVRRGETVTPVPLAPPSVAGIVNLRGQILSVIDGRRRFGIARGGEPCGSVHVVIESDGEAVSLAVDGERDVVELDAADIEPVPPTIPATIAGLLSGVHPIEAGLLLVLDPDRALSVA